MDEYIIIRQLPSISWIFSSKRYGYKIRHDAVARLAWISCYFYIALIGIVFILVDPFILTMQSALVRMAVDFVPLFFMVLIAGYLGYVRIITKLIEITERADCAHMPIISSHPYAIIAGLLMLLLAH